MVILSQKFLELFHKKYKIFIIIHCYCTQNYTKYICAPLCEMLINMIILECKIRQKLTIDSFAIKRRQIAPFGMSMGAGSYFFVVVSTLIL